MLRAAQAARHRVGTRRRPAPHAVRTPLRARARRRPLLLTFSAGVASFPQEASDLSGLLRRADQRLQQAKRAGRNRVLARDA